MLICGVDEAGRGPLAGPVMAAAVILPKEYTLKNLNDSKVVSKINRERLYREIMKQAVAWQIAQATAEEIDTLNILEASLLAMQRAVDALPVRPDLALVDGNVARGFSVCCRAIVHGDALEPCISAASILAKVARDDVMRCLASQYPGYGFERHMGYPTRLHYAALDALGPCPAHRRSFLRKWECRQKAEETAASSSRDSF